MLGDKDGVMVIPAHLADEIAEECTGMESFEAFVLEEVQGGAAIIGLYPPTEDENQKNTRLGGQRPAADRPLGPSLLDDVRSRPSSRSFCASAGHEMFAARCSRPRLGKFYHEPSRRLAARSCAPSQRIVCGSCAL